MDGEIEIRVGNVRVEIDADNPMAVYHAGHVAELKRAVVQACLAMDTDEARQLATRIEGMVPGQ